MRIRRIKVKNYGPFAESFEITFSSPCTVVVDENETGKSTLAEAILYGLYGGSEFSKKRRGEEAEVQLEIEKDGSIYIIQRSPKQVSLLKDGQKPSDFLRKWRGRYIDIIGEKITGLKKEEFLKTIFLKQHDLIKIHDLSSLTDHLQRTVDSAAGDISVREVIQKLKEGKKKNFPRLTTELKKEGSVDDEINKLDKKLREKRRELNSLKSQKRDNQKIIIEYERLEEEKKRLEKERNSLKLRELKLIMEEDEEKRKRRENLEAELKSLEVFKDFPLDREEEIIETYTKYKEKNERLKEKKEEFKSLEDELRKKEEEFKKYENFEGASSFLIEEIKRLEIELKNCEEEKRSISEKLKKEKEIFPWDLERFKKLYSIFSNLSQTEKFILEKYNENKAKLEKEKEKYFSQKEYKQFQRKEIEKKKKYILTLSGIIFIMGLILGFVLHSLCYLLIPFSVLLYFLLTKNISQKLNFLNTEISELEEKEEEKRRELLKLEDDLQKIKEVYGVGIDEYFEYLKGREKYSKIKHLEDRLEETNEKLEKINGKITDYKRSFGIGETFPLELFIQNLEKYSELKKEIEELEKKREISKKELFKMEKEVKELAEHIKNLGEKAKLEINEKSLLEEVVKKFKEASEKAKRYKEVEKELQSIEILSEKERREYKKEIEELKKKEIEDKSELKNVNFIKLEIQRIEKKLEKIQENMKTLRFEYKKYVENVKKIKELEEEIEKFEKQKKKAEMFREAVEIAIKELEKIMKEHHGKWAEELNKRATEIFQGLTLKGREIIFNPDLSFVLKDNERIIPKSELEGVISGGTLEQLHLSIRLAISDYLSQNQKLPLILDEPFAHSDDERFIKGMKYLCEKVAKERQVIIFSCHQNRHKLLKNVTNNLVIKKLQEEKYGVL